MWLWLGIVFVLLNGAVLVAVTIQIQYTFFSSQDEF
jgi:hypothetical protein